MGNKITRRRPAIDERFTRPQGLYPHRDVDHRKLRKLILDAKLAPCYPGAEEPAADLEECPICFLHYPSLNRSKCCAKGICTECFLQMKSPHVSRPTQCPFCKTPNYAVEYRGAKTMEEKGVEQAEEQKVIEAKIRMRQQELQDEEERVQRREDGIRDGIVSSLPSPPATPSNIHGAFPVTLNDAEVDAATVIDAVTVGGREPRARGTNGRPVGTPQPGIFSTAGLFATPSVAVDPDSLWFRASQRTDATDLAGGLRQPMLASTNLPSMSISSSNSLGSNSGGMGSMGVGPGGVLGPVTGLRGGGPTYARFNRDEDFDLDLEDIMVMEAIWLSIQEQGPQRHLENESNVAPENVSSVVSQITARHQDSRIGENESPSSRTVVQSADSREPLTRRNSVTGGLAGAIAALAERQVAGGGSGDYVTSSQVFHTADSVDSEPAEQRGGGQVAEQEGGLSSAGTAAEFHSENAGTSNSSPYSLHRQQGPAACERGSETEAWLQASQMHETGGLADWRGGVPLVSASDSHCGIHMREGSADQGGPSVSVPSAREGCGVGSLSGVMNDFSSHPANVRTSSGLSPASEPMGVAEEVSTNVLPEASGETGSGAENMVPESFEEQMMLAMALSLAEAQARDGRDDERGAQL